MPITATAIGVLAANCILDCPGVEAWGRSEHFERRCVRGSVAQARGAESLPRHRAGRLASLPAKESEGRQQPRLPDSRREDCLLAIATTNERTRVGRQCPDGVQPANGDARRFQRGLEETVPPQRGHRRNRVRAKGTLWFGSDAVFAVPPDLVVGATKILVIGQKPITATAIGILATNCILDCPVVEAEVCS